MPQGVIEYPYPPFHLVSEFDKNSSDLDIQRILFASCAKVHSHVIVLGRTTSRNVWVAVRCAVGNGGRWSAPRFIFLHFDTNWAIRALQPVPNIAGGCIAGGCNVVVINVSSEISEPVYRFFSHFFKTDYAFVR